MKAELDAGHPIVVNVGPGDFTDTGHFMVITGYDDGKRIYANSCNYEQKNTKVKDGTLTYSIVSKIPVKSKATDISMSKAALS